jgi:taurine dioxygenase
MGWTANRLGATLGAEIVGLDASIPIDDAEFDSIVQVLGDGDGVLVLRDQNLTPDQQISFSRRFGPLFGEAEPLQDSVAKYLLPGSPQIFRVSNKVVDGEAQGRERAGNYWHSDVSFRRRPAMMSLLYAIELPEEGSNTLFCNMYSAYETLSDPVQRFLDGLEARHDFAVNTKVGFANETIEEQDLEGQNAAIHPVVRVHPDSGRKCLFVNQGNTSHILGIHPKESRVLLDFLYKHATDAEHIYQHRWQPGDLVIWDNRCTMHYAIVDYVGDRYLHRTTVIGERPCAVST